MLPKQWILVQIYMEPVSGDNVDVVSLFLIVLIWYVFLWIYTCLPKVSLMELAQINSFGNFQLLNVHIKENLYQTYVNKMLESKPACICILILVSKMLSHWSMFNIQLLPHFLYFCLRWCYWPLKSLDRILGKKFSFLPPLSTTFFELSQKRSFTAYLWRYFLGFTLRKQQINESV